MITKFSLLNNGRFWAREKLGRSRLGLSAIGVHPRLRDKVVRPDSKMCVEGYPRCANSFLYEIIAARMPEAHIAHHIHVPSQIYRSVDFGVPVVVVIRNPLDAVASLLAVSDCRLSAGLALASYIRFYESIEQYTKNLYVADFPRITKDTLTVLKEIDARYDTAFASCGFDESDEKSAMDRLVKKNREMKQPANLVAIPDPKKTGSNTRARDIVSSHRDLSTAQSLYEHWQQLP